MLLFHDQNYGIHYEYTVPVNYTAENQSEPEKPQDSLFLWTHSGWEGCSVQCGGGEPPGSWACWVRCGVLPEEGVNPGHSVTGVQGVGKAGHVTSFRRNLPTPHCSSLCKTLPQSSTLLRPHSCSACGTGPSTSALSGGLAPVQVHCKYDR